MNIRKSTLSVLAIILLGIICAIPAMAFQKQNAAVPGEVLDSDADETTAVWLSGTFAYEQTSTGIGTIQIKRSENKSNWVVVKVYTNTAAGDQRKYLYESMGDGAILGGAWYKAVLSGAPTSGSFRVRLVK